LYIKKDPEAGSFLISEERLLQLDGGAGGFELALGLLGVSLGDVFLDRLGSAVNEGLGLGQT
jgi:hypothetical protein